jgi:hypothetical protein
MRKRINLCFHSDICSHAYAFKYKMHESTNIKFFSFQRARKSYFLWWKFCSPSEYDHKYQKISSLASCRARKFSGENSKWKFSIFSLNYELDYVRVQLLGCWHKLRFVDSDFFIFSPSCENYFIGYGRENFEDFYERWKEWHFQASLMLWDKVERISIGFIK